MAQAPVDLPWAVGGFPAPHCFLISRPAEERCGTRRQYGDFGIMSGNDTRYPTFYTFILLKYFARAGDRIVRATSDHKLLSVYAARRADGTLSLLVINKSPGATLKADCSIAGFQPGSGSITYSYGIPQDEAARTGTGSPDIAQASFTGAVRRLRPIHDPLGRHARQPAPSSLCKECADRCQRLPPGGRL